MAFGRAMPDHPAPPAFDAPALDAWMDRAIALARRGEGHVSPNPMVGCVVVDADGDIVGEGGHGRYGGPHAEVEAIADAERHDADLTRCTVVVTLEPCAHTGKTPPCADLLVAKRVGRVVVGMRDPFPRVDGRGIERLRAAGIDVTVGVREAECQRLVEAFTTHVRTGRPLVTLKLAQTLDGFAATTTGDSRWVTGEAARRRVHELRAAADAVLVGTGTARDDDPALTLRHGVTGTQPLRIVLDRAGVLPADLTLFTDAFAQRTVGVVDAARCGRGPCAPWADALRSAGGTVLPIPTTDGHLGLGALLDRLGAGEGLPPHPDDPPGSPPRPVQSLLVEAGPGLASALVEADLVDRLLVFIAPMHVGRGRPALDLPPVSRMADATRWSDAAWEVFGDDVLMTARRPR